jgi:predicted nuclease with TOPRIM domain
MNKKSQIFEEIINDYITLLQSYQNQRSIAEQNIVKYTNFESKYESLKKQNKDLQDFAKKQEETIAKLQKENATVTKQFRELESSFCII